ncbi:hypothetical protein E4U17_002611 [Claviceps sp. LM77 group G4]|nr:hypothetical protein E4U17_002611 [Claviceps sp. LM77 group G4]KAG6074114.1 hypothetical protein E4U33_002646 [Claviceps sp. LM78 group G4]KAG6076050.1 hypothetical protein E4U16_003009 [Claviceps sp. LM84 group G4]
MGQGESAFLDDPETPLTLTEKTLPAVAAYVKSGSNHNPKQIVVLAGAGISTSAGIPDFRSPGTGIYSHLARLNLPDAEAVFDIDFFRENPLPFYCLARELYPGKFYPTVSHAFLALLAKKGVLLKVFTQNIDCLERRVGVPPEKIIEAHGSFATQRCIDCRKEFPDREMKLHVADATVPYCKDPHCRGIVKPDIVFFGEAMPTLFRDNCQYPATADVILVMGTSLSVAPFSATPDMAPGGTPRLLINKERVGSLGHRTDDVLVLGTCDDGVRKFADELGWRDELEALWRGVVGDEEAERQLVSAAKQKKKLEDEVNLLTERVESALKLDDQSGQDGPGQDGPSEDGHIQNSLSQDAEPACRDGRSQERSSEEDKVTGDGFGMGLSVAAAKEEDAASPKQSDASVSNAIAVTGHGADEQMKSIESSANPAADKAGDSKTLSLDTHKETHDAPQDTVTEPMEPRAVQQEAPQEKAV